MLTGDFWQCDPASDPEGLRIPTPAIGIGAHSLLDLNGDKEKLTGLDSGNAQRFRILFQHCARYSSERKKWLVFWSGDGIWRWDETSICLQMARKALYEWYRQAKRADSEENYKLARKSLDDLYRFDRMLRLAGPLMPIRLEELDRQPDLLVFKNGTLNLATGELGKSKSVDLVSRRLEYAYDPDANCPLFQNFLSRALGGHSAMSGSQAEELRQMLLAVQLYMGYSLTGRTSSKAVFIWHGPTNTGKTTFLNLFLSLLGAYGATLQIESLMRGAEQGNAAQADLADLHGARFVMSSEVGEGQRLDVRRLKGITQGGAESRIKARRLHENPFSFFESHKLHLDSNYLPHVPDNDSAFWGRVFPIPWEVQIPECEQDRKLSEKLLAEAPGILAWAARGSKRWYDIGGVLDRPASVREAGAAYKTAMDMVHQFVEDCLTKDDAGEVGSTELYRAWEHWAHERRCRPLTHKAFSMKMRALGWDRVERRDGAYYHGLKL
jgi:putative DNA primase/helicase